MTAEKRRLLMRLHDLTSESVAAHHRVSPRTVRRVVADATDGPQAETIRRFIVARIPDTSYREFWGRSERAAA